MKLVIINGSNTKVCVKSVEQGHFCWGCPAFEVVHVHGGNCLLGYKMVYNEEACMEQNAFQRPEDCKKDNGE